MERVHRTAAIAAALTFAMAVLFVAALMARCAA
jgi:hypothetical protein